MYYQGKLQEIEGELLVLKEQGNYKNIGCAFVSFKDKNCTYESLEDLETWKIKLREDPLLIKAELEEWEIEQAPPPNDVIWHNLNKSYNMSVCTKGILFLLPLILSISFVFGVVYLEERLTLEGEWNVAIIVKYFAPACLVLINFLAVPYFLYFFEERNKYEQKSDKDESFIHKNIIYMILNGLFIPFIVSAILVPPPLLNEDGTPKYPTHFPVIKEPISLFDESGMGVSVKSFSFNAFSNSEFFARYLS